MDVAVAGVRCGTSGLEVPLPDGRRAYFNAWWLRDNDPRSFDPVTRERVYDIFHRDGPPIPEAAWVEDEGLIIRWVGEAEATRHRLDWLAAHADGRMREDVAELPRRLWYADHYPRIARFAQAELKADRARVADWIEALIVDGVAIVEGMPDNDAGLTETVELMGQVRPTFFGAYFDVRLHIEPTNLAYTAKALELHTDTPAEDPAPGVQFLHCRANSVEGGYSLFADGAAVAEDFRAEAPEAFAVLAGTAVPFYCEHDHYDMRSRQRVIELDRHGAVEGVTISQHMLDVSDLDQRLLDAWYPAFAAFGRKLMEPKYLMRFRLNAGECIVFDNHRIVHGREAYTAESGTRYLRGVYADRGEMRSTFRAIRGRGRFGGAR
jgi:gamma-butyrobetaine dioxygenase